MRVLLLGLGACALFWIGYAAGFCDGKAKAIDNPHKFLLANRAIALDTRKVARFCSVNTSGSLWALLVPWDSRAVIVREDGLAENVGYTEHDLITVSPVDLVRAINGGGK